MATLSSPVPVPPPTKGSKDLTRHDSTAGGRQDDAGTTRPIEPSQPIGKPVLEYPSSDTPRSEEVPRVKREYISVDSKIFPKLPSFDNSTHPADSLNDHVDFIIKLHRGVETTLDSPHWVSRWESPVQDAIRIEMSRKSVRSKARFFFNTRSRMSSPPSPTAPQAPKIPSCFFVRSTYATWARFRRRIWRNKSVLLSLRWAPLSACIPFASVSF